MFPRTGLWAHADFMRLWSAQAISAFGSRITRTALPIIAVQTLQQSETVVALLSSVYLAPGVLLALFAGGVVDRSRKRRILVAADIFRAAVVASVTIAWLFGALAMWHLVMVGALVGAASALFTIADVAYLPTLLDKRALGEGNAKLETTEAVAEVTGPASAGVLIGVLGAPLAVAIDAASYLWSALMLGRIRTHEAPARAAPTAESSTWQAQRDLRDGMRAIFGHPHVRAVVLALMVWSIAGGFFTALYTLFCLRTLGLSELTFGVIIAVGGIGSFGGALISRRLVTSIGLGRTMIVSAAISLLGGLLIPLAHGPRITVLLFLGAHQLISDCFSVAFVIQAVTLRQTVLPKALLGRANAAVHVCTAGLVPVVALLAGLLAELTSIRTAVWAGVSIGLIAPLFLLPLRNVRLMPESHSSTEITRATTG
ncbi:MAG TPA: MFS transporter [Kofleriaceae bacterium]